MGDTFDEKRRFQREKMYDRTACQFFVDAQVPGMDTAIVHDISQSGVLVETTVKPVLGAIIFVGIKKEKVERTIDIKRLQSYIEIQIGTMSFVRMCGKVVRVKEQDNGTFLVGVHIINK